MATELTKPVARRVRRTGVSGRDLLVTLTPPGGDDAPALITIRENGGRTSYSIGVGALFVKLAKLGAEDARIAKRGARAKRGGLL